MSFAGAGLLDFLELKIDEHMLRDVERGDPSVGTNRTCPQRKVASYIRMLHSSLALVDRLLHDVPCCTTSKKLLSGRQVVLSQDRIHVLLDKRSERNTSDSRDSHTGIS